MAQLTMPQRGRAAGAGLAPTAQRWPQAGAWLRCPPCRRPQAAARLRCHPCCRPQQPPRRCCCCCRLAGLSASWRCPPVCRAPRCRPGQRAALAAQPSLQGKQGCRRATSCLCSHGQIPLPLCVQELQECDRLPCCRGPPTNVRGGQASAHLAAAAAAAPRAGEESVRALVATGHLQGTRTASTG